MSWKDEETQIHNCAGAFGLCLYVFKREEKYSLCIYYIVTQVCSRTNFSIVIARTHGQSELRNNTDAPSLWSSSVWGVRQMALHLRNRASESGYGPRWKNFFRALEERKTAKNPYTNSERLTLSCRVAWAWSERANLYNRQIITLPRKTRTYQNRRAPGPLQDSRAVVICTGLPPLVGTAEDGIKADFWNAVC
jgi:hypothetical protein